jgi:hypothetical protein
MFSILVIEKPLPFTVFHFQPLAGALSGTNRAMSQVLQWFQAGWGCCKWNPCRIAARLANASVWTNLETQNGHGHFGTLGVKKMRMGHNIVPPKHQNGRCQKNNLNVICHGSEQVLIS